MKVDTVKYANDQVAVLWKPKLCIHSAKCWKNLPEVFKPREKKWVDVNGAEAEKIIEQVRQCPSGALSIENNSEKNNKMENSNVKITVNPNGPLMVEGNVVVIKDGKEEVKEKAFLCRCGHSKNKPYCDGAHKANNFIG